MATKPPHGKAPRNRVTLRVKRQVHLAQRAKLNLCALGGITAPVYLLVPQVKLSKRLDLARDAERALDSVPGLIVANWVEGRLG